MYDYMWRDIKTIPKPEEFYRYRAPADFELPGSDSVYWGIY